MFEKIKKRNGFLLLEALLFLVASTVIMYYFSSSIAHMHLQYKKIQLYNYAQQTVYAYTKQAQIYNTPLSNQITHSFCDCVFTITQQYKPVKDFNFLPQEIQYVQTVVSWNDIHNKDEHTCTMSVIPWNVKDDIA